MARRDIEKEITTFYEQKNVSLVWRQEYEDVWDRNVNYLKTKYFTAAEVLEEDKVCVNMVHPHVRVVVPAVYSKNPDVTIKYRRKDAQLHEILTHRANTASLLMKYFIKENNLKKEFKLSILDGVLTGHSWIKNGFESQFAKEEEEGEEQNPQKLVEKFMNALGFGGGEENENHLFTNYKITSQAPWALRTSYKDIIVPAFSRRPEELDWIAERFILPYDEVMANEDFDTKGLKPNSNANALLATLRGSTFDSKKYPDGEKQEYVILWEKYYRKDKKICVIAEDFKDHYIQEKDSPFTYLESGFHPYTMMRFNEIPDEFYPESDITPAEPQMLELNDIRTAQMNHIKRVSKRKYVSKPSALAEDQKTALRSGRDGVVIEIDSQYAEDAVETVLAPLQDAPIDSQLFAVETRTKEDVYNALGTNDYASAAGGASSATEASIMAARSQFRVQERIDSVNDFAEQVIRHMLQMCLKNLPQSEVIKILGEEDGIFWRRYNNDEDIRKEFMLDVIYGSTTPISEENSTAQFLQVYTVVQGNPIYNQLKFAEELLEHSRKFLSDDPEKYLNPQIAAALQEAILKEIEMGNLPETSTDASGSPNDSTRVPDLGKRGSSALRQRQASGGMESRGRPRVPGGKGGTADKAYS